MARTELTLLRSQFLLDVKAHFPPGRQAGREMVEFVEERSDSILDESLEILRYVTRGYGLFLYQTLTIWGDQVATYTVRENVKKRRYKLVHQVREFPLVASPDQIVDTFWWAARQLRGLNVPPGDAQEDRALLQAIENRWLELSAGQSH